MHATKMTTRSVEAAAPRPHDGYKREFLDRILGLRPQSVLDVGCGEGALLRSLAEAGCPRRLGLEPDEAVVALAVSAGLDVRAGRAERLPFADRSFDLVILDYVAHHVENLPQTLLEAARVADRAVLILDCWYDETLPTQQVAQAYDAWSKRIDRRSGMVHNPCPSAMDLAAPFLALGGFDIDIAHHLRLQPVAVETLEAKAQAHLTRFPGAADRRTWRPFWTGAAGTA